MLADILSHLGPIGQLLVGLAAISGVLGAFVRWIGKKTSREIIEANSHYMQEIIRKSLEREMARHSAEDYYTLDVEFEGGHRMLVPMFDGAPMLISENIEMAVNDHSKEGTELGLWCEGMGTLPPHFHRDTTETIHIERGTVTHLETGRIYRAGEAWEIPSGVWHSACFKDCYCRVIHRPPLPTAAVRPVDLDAMAKVFPKL